MTTMHDQPMLVPKDWTTAEILARLEVLWHKLEHDHGLYVGANTVHLAVAEIKRLAAKAGEAP